MAEAVLTALSICRDIYECGKAAKANKEQCNEIADRVMALQNGPLTYISNEIKQRSEIKPSTIAIVNRISDKLRSVHEYMQKMGNASFLRHMFSQWFGDFESTLKDISGEIDSCVNDLNLGLTAENRSVLLQLVSSGHDVSAKISEMQRDMSQIMAMQNSTNAKMDDVVRLLQDMCNRSGMDSTDSVSAISQFSEATGKKIDNLSSMMSSLLATQTGALSLFDHQDAGKYWQEQVGAPEISMKSFAITFNKFFKLGLPTSELVELFTYVMGDDDSTVCKVEWDEFCEKVNFVYDRTAFPPRFMVYFNDWKGAGRAAAETAAQTALTSSSTPTVLALVHAPSTVNASEPSSQLVLGLEYDGTSACPFASKYQDKDITAQELGTPLPWDGGRHSSNTIQLGEVVVSRYHFNIFYRDYEGVILQDLGSGSGTFVNIQGRHRLTTRTNVLVGQTILCFDPAAGGSAATGDDAPTVMGKRSVGGAGPMQVSVVSGPAGDFTTSVHPQTETVIGRGAHKTNPELPKVILNNDPHMSREHMRVYWADGSWWIEDKNSSKGTYVQLPAKTPFLLKEINSSFRVGNYIFTVKSLPPPPPPLPEGTTIVRKRRASKGVAIDDTAATIVGKRR
eukprot:GILI01002441.1.p1 GENE.GILI01002441.1~~GILI01002441.1.p1  ORF type:complete len:622 (+),score=224.77 GILI01002441.1:53-1918(+)